MRLPGRVAAVVEVLSSVLDGAQVENAMAAWARSNRFAGSKDRSFMRDMIYDILRTRQSCAFAGGGDDPRGLAIGWTRLQGHDPNSIFGADAYGPAALSDAEAIRLARPMQPRTPHPNLPNWIAAGLKVDLGEDFEDVAQALSHRAPIDLRVNMRKTSRDALARALEKDGIFAEPVGPDTCLRVVDGGRTLSKHPMYEAGHFEFQDAHSQAVCNTISISSAQRVLDYCAGGGGKSLALADRVSEATYFAWDASPKRLSDIPLRADRAGTHIDILTADPARSDALFDTVVLDVPCSGSGSWRRDPQARWTLTPLQLGTLVKLQAELLIKAERLCAPGGQIAYVTCSLFRDENEGQISTFQDRFRDWTVNLQNRWLPSALGDGFFLCVLSRDQRS
ncbi:MAG: RsmB/NOP family class I SAM-dependent RNA methyltransferase [Pseudomonadota bacterium]